MKISISLPLHDCKRFHEFKKVGMKEMTTIWSASICPWMLYPTIGTSMSNKGLNNYLLSNSLELGGCGEDVAYP